jgi:hypothetical protein
MEERANGIEVWSGIWYPKVWIEFDQKYDEFYLNYVI